MNDIEQLNAENSHLRQMVRLDALTMLLNRSVFEQEVNLALKECDEGALLKIDLDNFKEINDQYGHFTGDKVLQTLAKILSAYFFSQDLVGRMGGDEFAVFLRGKYREDMLEQKINSAIGRFIQSGRELGIKRRLSFTVGVATATIERTFQALYPCADIALLRGKQKAAGAIHFYNPRQTAMPHKGTKKKSPPAFFADVQNIRKQLQESEPEMGAYYPDYQKFMAVYHFLERSLCRCPQSVPLILISLTDASGEFPQPEDRAQLTQILAENIKASLRTSDIFTQYSSVQFLLMAPGADSDNITLIQNRICQTMKDSLPGRNDVILNFSYYPLQPTFHAAGFVPTWP